MHSALLTPPETRTMTAEEYLLAKLDYEATCPALKAEMERRPCPVVLLDVRDAAAYGKEHIPGALSFPEKELKRRLDKIPRGKVVVTYGWDSDCTLAPQAALTLARHGFKIQFLAGGIAEWRRRELPVASGR